MKRIINLAAMAAMLVAGVSCNKEPQVEPSVPSHGDFMKTISVDLGGSTRTRAASALSGEAAIEDATLFVWQHNGKTDETILYEKTYGEASTFEFNLLFSDQTDFTYTINAWANMGELSEEPEDGEVLFSGEESTGLQMKGSKSGIDQSSAASVTIDMKRYVGKITVSEVALEWTNKQNALQEFTLKSIYVANAGDKAEGAVATYNVDGAYVSSAMDAMLYSPVSSIIADGAKYDTPQMMYAYGSGTTELVLECDLGGQTMYYHVPYEPEANTHRAFKLTVRQAGAETPLGELPEEAIEVNVTTLNVLGFEDSEEGVDFGEKPVDPMANYLTIEALEDGLTAILSVNACEYCIDGDGNWKTLSAGTATEAINTGQTLSFRGKLTPVLYQGIGTFTINKKCNLKGNCMSMLFGDEAADNFDLSGMDYAFCGLFRICTNIVNVGSNFLPATILASGCYSRMFPGCTSLTTAPELPATTLAKECYSNMFPGCTSLTTAPELPATTLADNCYDGMFEDCTSLTTAPVLPATTLAKECYYRMFYGCTSLTTAPELPATILASDCYESMFSGCTSLTIAPVLPATTLAKSCYQSMFRDCTNLTTAPELPTTTLADFCYAGMFSGCTSLTIAPVLPATTLASNCYESMFYGCTSLTTAPELPATILASDCYRSMFSGCTNLTTAPELPATTLAFSCYIFMFDNCSNLNYIKMLATDISAYQCLYNWVNGVSSTGTFVKNPAMKALPTSISGIPSGWTVEDASI